MGHILRGDSFGKHSLLGRIEGTRVRMRHRLKFVNTILQRFGDGRRTVDLMRLADDRGRWPSIVTNVTRLALQ